MAYALSQINPTLSQIVADQSLVTAEDALVACDKMEVLANCLNSLTVLPDCLSSCQESS